MCWVAAAAAARMIGALRRKRSLLTQNWSNSARSAACAKATYSARLRSLFSRRLKRIASSDNGLGFDLDQVAIADQPRLHQRVRRANGPKALAVHAGHRLPIIQAADIDARAHHVAQGAAQLEQGRLDLVQDETGLRRRVASADEALRSGGGGARDQDAVSHAHRPGIAG